MLAPENGPESDKESQKIIENMLDLDKENVNQLVDISILKLEFKKKLIENVCGQILALDKGKDCAAWYPQPKND